MSMSSPALDQLLTASLDPFQAKNATEALKVASQQPGFAIALLQTSGNAVTSLSTRLAAATLFKNHVRNHWVRLFCE